MKFSGVEVIVNPIEDNFLVCMDIFCGCVQLVHNKTPGLLKIWPTTKTFVLAW